MNERASRRRIWQHVAAGAARCIDHPFLIGGLHSALNREKINDLRGFVSWPDAEQSVVFCAAAQPTSQVPAPVSSLARHPCSGEADTV